MVALCLCSAGSHASFWVQESLKSPLVDGPSVTVTGGIPLFASVKRHLRPSPMETPKCPYYASHGDVLV